MRLGALTGGDEATPVTGFAIDHRKVAPGTVFGAFRGARFNGEDFIPAAVDAGAVAVVARPEVPVEGAAHVRADEPRREFARLAARFFKPFPQTVVAVTGTNGKTSNVELTRQLWRMAGHHAASIGTLGVISADDPKSGEVAKRCEERGLRRLTVGTKGEALRLVERVPTQLGQRLTIKA